MSDPWTNRVLSAVTAALLCLAAPSGRAQAQYRDVLHLHNGDVLAGTLQSILPEEGVLWQYDPDFPSVQFRYEAVRKIQLQPVMPPVEPESFQGLFRLADGDELVGRLQELNADQVTMQTRYGGQLIFHRNRWQWVLFDDEPVESVFSGPKGLEGWTRSDVSVQHLESGKWLYRDQAFYAHKAASIARDVKLPDVARIRFDFQWKGIPNLALALYTDYLHPVNLGDLAAEPKFGGFYSLQFLHNYANVLVVEQNAQLQRLGLGQIQVPAFVGKNRASIDIRVNKPQASLALLVDGKLVKIWVDNNGFSGEGTGIRLVHQGMGSSIRVSQLRIEPWNGQLEQPPAIRAKETSDALTRRDGERREGEIQTIRDGKVQLASDQEPVELPLADIRKIEFGGIPNRPVRPQADELTVTAKFAGRGLIRLNLRELREGRLQGDSPNYGLLDLDLRTFEELLFGP